MRPSRPTACHLALVRDKETVSAVLNDLAGCPVGEGDDGRPARQRLDHDHPERLGPADRHQQGGRAREQPLLRLASDLAHVRHVPPVELGRDLRFEERPLPGLNRAGQDQRQAGAPRGVDRAMRTLDLCLRPIQRR